MFKSVRDKWLTALRSGEFKQGQKQLQDGDTFCCLGVLATVVDPEKKTWYEDNPYFGSTYSNSTGSEIRSKLQIKLIGTPLPVVQCEELIRMNDTLAKSFKDIADWIELNVPQEEG